MKKTEREIAYQIETWLKRQPDGVMFFLFLVVTLAGSLLEYGAVVVIEKIYTAVCK
jgi:hypothetical protein